MWYFGIVCDCQAIAKPSQAFKDNSNESTNIISILLIISTCVCVCESISIKTSQSKYRNNDVVSTLSTIQWWMNFTNWTAKSYLIEIKVEFFFMKIYPMCIIFTLLIHSAHCALQSFFLWFMSDK